MYLNCHSYYSLRYGTMSVETLVEQAAGRGVQALALTDINNSMGIMDFIKACRQHGIHPVAGIEFRDGNRLLYTGVARNNDGFRELNEFLTACNVNKQPLPADPPPFKDAWTIFPFGSKTPAQLLDNEYAGIRPSEVRRLFSSPFRHKPSKLVINQSVTFGTKDDYAIHRHLRAVDNNTLLSKINGEHLAAADEHFRPLDQLLEAFRSYPDVIRNTEHLLGDAHIDFDFSTIKNKDCFTGSRYDDKLLLEKLALDGMVYRYGKHNPEASQRVKHELEIIDRMGFSAYFLITWDIIRYSMSRGFYHVGRGSGANSVVAYCLKITDVDPIELDLYFERFINPKRTSPPDFDIDYSWKERDEVLDYIFKRYGKKHTALLGTISTFRDRSIVRELGKVYGLPKTEIDHLVQYPDDMMNRSRITEKIMYIGHKIMDFPNQRSIHAGGVLISEAPITAYTALDMPPKGFQTTQWDMYVAEEIGFEKLDILSQRGIGHIRECVDIVLDNQRRKIDVHDVEAFKKDPKVRDQLRRGETNGCFYVESPAMRGLLKKLRCDNYLGLVAASSIIRPGVAKSGMMREYIWRFHHPDEFEYIHPVMEEQLKETYGVMVYQEDVIKICHHFAGLDLADADVLRRAMSGKFRSKSEFKRIAARYFENCKARGYTDELTREVWRQIESFAGYSFSKAHSASYAVESFQSLYLKSHFPLEFMVAVINNFGGFYRTWVYVNEARRCGATINLPCINRSQPKTSIRGKDIYLGFIHISNLESRTISAILEERELRGPYKSLNNFVSRVPIGLEQLVILIRIDAFRFTGKGKKVLLWDAHMQLGQNTTVKRDKSLFQLPEKKFTLPELEENTLEDVYDEIELLDFPVTLTSFDLLKTSFRGEIMARDLMKHTGRMVRMVGNLVTIKNVRTVKKEWMHFAAFLDAEGEFFDTIHFPKSLKKYPFRGYGVYLILGKVEEELGFPSITVEKLAKLPVKPDPRY
ncbi:MAG: DNA polymerase III subunit alpha [Bacteroides sp. SM23_62]|nr:MAG: DNA polymerase III subunit alpha [Bacteroides sp. SM23_62]